MSAARNATHRVRPALRSGFCRRDVRRAVRRISFGRSLNGPFEARAVCAIVERMSRCAAWVVCVASLAACYRASPAVGVPCATNGACPRGQVCDHALDPPICVTELSADAAVDAEADGQTTIDGTLPTTPTLVQQSADSATSGPLTVTLSSLPAAGDVVLVLAGSRQAPLRSVSGGGVTDWKFAARSVINCNEEIWYGITDGTSAAVSLFLPNNTGVIFGHVSQWRGLATTPLDAATAHSAAASPAAPGTITTRHASDLLVLAASEPGQVTWGEPAPGTWTALTPVVGGACEQAAWYRFVTETGDYAPTVTESGTENWDAAVAAFVVKP
jgi:hypothetical protein